MPKCAACQFGKQVCRTSPGTTTKQVKDEADVLKAGNLHPGQKVSADHFVCSMKGCLFDSSGKTKEDNMYSEGCIFVDHSSGYAHVEFQCHLNTHETLKAKTNFENCCRDVGAIPQEYLADNGSAFSSQEFAMKLSVFKWVLHFTGVGAHHHKAIAERGILDNYEYCPDHDVACFHPCLWPMAICMQCSFIITSLTLLLACHLWLSSQKPVGHKNDFMICTFSSPLSMFLTRPSKMARKSLTGSLIQSIFSSWGSPEAMLPALHWF